MVRHYDLGVDEEHLNARRGAALLHRSELQAYRLSGRPEALRQFGWAGAVAATSQGRFGRIALPGRPTLAYEHALLVTLKQDAEWLLLTHEGSPHVTSSEGLMLRSLGGEWAVLDALGPAAAVGLEMAMAGDLVDLPEGGSVATQMGGAPVRVVRHRGLGDDGFFVLAQARYAPQVWSTLTSQLFQPTGYDTFESLRIEAGVPMPYTEVAPAHGAIAPQIAWVALRSQERRLLRQGYRITNALGEPIGEVTSGSDSPVGRQTHAIGWVQGTAIHEEAPAFVEVRGQTDRVHLRQCPFTISSGP